MRQTPAGRLWQHSELLTNILACAARASLTDETVAPVQSCRTGAIVIPTAFSAREGLSVSRLTADGRGRPKEC